MDDEQPIQNSSNNDNNNETLINFRFYFGQMIYGIDSISSNKSSFKCIMYLIEGIAAAKKYESIECHEAHIYHIKRTVSDMTIYNIIWIMEF